MIIYYKQWRPKIAIAHFIIPNLRSLLFLFDPMIIQKIKLKNIFEFFRVCLKFVLFYDLELNLKWNELHLK